LLIAVAVGGRAGHRPAAGWPWHALRRVARCRADRRKYRWPPLILGLVALVLAGNLLASLPAAVAARTQPGVGLRTE